MLPISFATWSALLLATFVLFAARTDTRPTPMPLWKEGAPLAKGTEQTDIPSIAMYAPKKEDQSGAAVIVCPGGAYWMLADHEGHDIAVWLNAHGITAFVLKYRLAPNYGYPAPILDAARAVRTVRARAGEWGIDPHRIGIIGFSAGGHVASTTATHFDDGDPKANDPIDRVSSRPDLAILCYAVISMEDGVTHGGSKKNLLGDAPAADLVKLLSNETQVTPNTPPTFLFHTADDGAVPAENALRFASALAKAKVPYELHLYANGPHGVGLAQGDPVLKTWPGLLANWLYVRGFIKTPDASH